MALVKMSLNLDLSTAPNFQLCTFTPNTGTICASPGQGTINFTFRRLDQFSFTSVDNLIQSSPGVRFQTNGTSAGNDASVQGTIFGTTLAVYSADMGNQRQASHSVFIP